MKLIDLTGNVYGRLTVIERAENYKHYTCWLCKCECGNEAVVRSSDLRFNKTKSCGCLRKEFAQKLNNKHGKSKTTEFKIWKGINQRCNNKNNKSYEDYGGRGIKVCKRWSKFENFLVDMGEMPPKKHSIERIDVNGDYEPSNCKWASVIEQSRNHRLQKNNSSGYKGISWDNESSKWVAYIGLNKKTIKLGRFLKKEDAIKARKEAETKYWNKTP